MITGNNTNPENNVYNIGAKIIQVLKTYDQKSVDYFQVYNDLNKNEDISFSLFSLALDWLFLIDVVDNNKGHLKKCF